MNINQKRQREKEVVSLMIKLYCKKKHHTKEGLCEECSNLDSYAKLRSDKCPFMEKKTSVLIVRYIAINRRCGEKSERLCGFQDRE